MFHITNFALASIFYLRRVKFPVGKKFQRLNYRLGFIEAEIDRLNRKGNGWLEIAFRPASDREIQRRASMTKDPQRHGYTGESRIEQIGSTGISRFVRKLGPIERRKKRKDRLEERREGRTDEPVQLSSLFWLTLDQEAKVRPLRPGRPSYHDQRWTRKKKKGKGRAGERRKSKDRSEGEKRGERINENRKIKSWPESRRLGNGEARSTSEHDFLAYRITDCEDTTAQLWQPTRYPYRMGTLNSTPRRCLDVSRSRVEGKKPDATLRRADSLEKLSSILSIRSKHSSAMCSSDFTRFSETFSDK